MKTVYVLIVEKAWARLYKTASSPVAVTLVYHHAWFGVRPGEAGTSTDDELARNLCRILRADRQTGKYKRLVMLASDAMLTALRRQYDGEWSDVTTGTVEGLPVRYADEDLNAFLSRLLGQGGSQQKVQTAPPLSEPKAAH